jgi:hypothetical protein
VKLSETRIDIIRTAGALRPVQLSSRLEKWKRLGLPGGAAGEMVATSFGHPMPVDADGDGGDAMDQAIQAAERRYRDFLLDALKLLEQATAIERKWLVEIRVANEDDARSASDSGADCKRCLRPVACTPKDKLLAGFCSSCFRWWTRNGRPDIVKKLTEAEAIQEAIAG